MYEGNQPHDLVQRKNQLLQEKSKLGIFRTKRKRKIDSELGEIDALLSQNSKRDQKTEQGKNDPAKSIVKLEIFSTDGKTPDKQVSGTVFMQAETAAIGVKVFFHKDDGMKTVNLCWQIFREDGTPFGKQANVDIPVVPDESSVYHLRGWKEAGRWPAGRYKIVAAINGGKPVDACFEIKPGQYGLLYSRLRTVRLFVGGVEAPPMGKREYRNAFSKNSFKFLYFEAEFPEPGKKMITTFDFSVMDEKDCCVANGATTVELRADCGYCCQGYGSEIVDFWAPGRYTYTVSVGKSPAISGSFEIR